jgi:hypothetical protein
MSHPDKILSFLCSSLVNRRLFKVQLQAGAFDIGWVEELRKEVCLRLQIDQAESGYFIVEGEAENRTYDPSDERINILYRNGSVKDISMVDNALIHHNLAIPVKKFYICYLNQPR